MYTPEVYIGGQRCDLEIPKRVYYLHNLTTIEDYAYNEDSTEIAIVARKI
jgi:hypothetical protein